MPNIKILPLGSYQTNCYLVFAEGSSRCAVIDPGFEPETVLAELARLNQTPEAILLTHGHFDHVGAAEELVKATGCRIWIHKGDQTLPESWLYPLAGKKDLLLCEEGQQLSVAGLTFTVLHTPGHTAGSVCYRCEDALFCGDTLFAGSCGRIDLPGGDRIAMLDSLERLAAMEEDLSIYPGHGPTSTLACEQAGNPYLQ